ncbi:DUF4142 domain-containing protein [Chitinophagaceae bacterium MMS25-I14]
MKNTTLQLLIATFMLSAVAACGNHEPDSKETAKEENSQKFDSTTIEGDTKFAVTAADGGMMEVQLGKLALTNASDQQVKALGQMMINDHSKANDELKQVATQKNISLPAALSDKHQQKYDELSKKTGAEFDKAYTDLMVDDHKEDIEEFQKEADKGNDADLKTWAAGKVPVLQQHLQMAQTAQDAVKNSK